jgi:uracil-DNA glycosylase family 4
MKRASDDIRKHRIIALHRMLHPETGRIIASAFQGEYRRCQKAMVKQVLDAQIVDCHGCNLAGCPRACGWGDLNARHMLIGQSLHEPGVHTGIPFIVPGCGALIDAALRLTGMTRCDIFLTNAVHCHPERNRPSTQAELDACRPFLAQEIRIIQPEMLVCLGNDAKASVAKIKEDGGIPEGCLVVSLIHPAATLRMHPEATGDFVLRLAQELERA